MANFPWWQHKGWRTVIGLLQRLYAPYFKATVFCGSWAVNTTSDGIFILFSWLFFPFLEDLPPIDPINFVHITKEEMRGGYAYGYCISKVRDLRLQNVTGSLIF